MAELGNRNRQPLLRLVGRIPIKLIEVVGGLAFLSTFGQAAWAWRLRRWRDRPATQARTAVVAHVFYPEMLHEIVACRRAVSETTDLHITTVPTLAQAIRAALRDEPRVHVHPCVNRGRDIAPFLALLNARILAPYDAVLKVHAKRSPHLWTGGLRRRLLLTLLAGRREQTARILALFARPEVGMVGWRACFRSRKLYWMLNEGRVRALAARMAPGAEIGLGFFEGSMFWFRPAALEPLRQLELSADQFEEEAGQIDGALHHAVERAFTLAAVAAAFDCVDISGRLLMPGRGRHGSRNNAPAPDASLCRDGAL